MGAGLPAHQITKAALNVLRRTLAGELRQAGILVNAICPSWVATDMDGSGRPVAQGAASMVWAATLPDHGPTGGFFHGDNSRVESHLRCAYCGSDVRTRCPENLVTNFVQGAYKYRLLHLKTDP
jgi:hypothetical protein